MKKVIITGIAGLLGSRLAKWIVENHPSVEIYGIDDLCTGYIGNIPTGVMSYEKISLGEDRSVQALRKLFGTVRPDIVFHFAAFAAEGLSPFVRTHSHRNNIIATSQIVNECLNYDVKRIVYTSSMAVYGRQQPPFSEDLPYAPIDPYGVGKAAAEQDIKIAGEQHGLDWTIIRPHNVYGANQNCWQDFRNVFGIWMRQHIEGKPLRIYGDGTQKRAFSFIDDALPCLWEASVSEAANREIINLGGTIETRIIDAAKMLIEAMGGGSLEHTEPRHEVKFAWSTWEKSVSLLGYEDRTNLRAGLSAMWKWFVWAWESYPCRRNVPAMKFEVEKGVYSWWRS